MSKHPTRSRSSISRRRARPGLETLEDRCLPSVNFLPRPQATKPPAAVAHAAAHPVSHAATHRVTPSYVLAKYQGQVRPFGTPGPSGYTPQQLQRAYGFDQIFFGGVKGDGTGQTIAIVDAFDDPTLVSSSSPTFATSDLHLFDLQFGLPDPVFTKVNQTGGSTLPRPDGGWSIEIALDVEWAHAIAPKANILLVEANTSNNSDMDAAVGYAASQPGVSAVSMSWGSTEYGGELTEDHFYTTPSGHAGVTFIAASGDSGAPPNYPAISPNVLAVGGTTLKLDGFNNISSESGWFGSGGGISNFEPRPSYQTGAGTGSTWRTNPDVAYDADGSTGVPVLDAYYNGSSAPWIEVGGTSAAAPQWAALVAIVNQGRALASQPSLDGRSQTLPYLYSLAATDFHDITAGGSTGSPPYSATPGYDYVTGRGTPVANLLVPGLVAPELQLLDGGGVIAKGGSVTVTGLAGTTVTHTFTVSNLSAYTLTLSDPINLPTGFSLASDFGSTSLAPGASTTFVVKLDTSKAGSYSGTVSFGSNDPNGSPFTFTLNGTVTAVYIGDDSAASGFSTAGTWFPYSGQGYLNTVHFAASGTGSSTASWTFSVSPGQYLVSATWSANPNRATNSPYTVLDGTTPLSTVAVNQELTPSDRTDSGVGWKDLGTFSITGSTLAVMLSNAANGYVIADAIRVEYKGGLPSGPVARVFDGSTLVANGGSDSFGTTAPGAPVTKTFTVKNTGSTALTLSDPINLPSGFSLASDFGSTTVAPGATTTFAVRLTAATAGSYSGALSFGTNDSADNPYSFTVSGTVSAAQLLDDSAASGFSTSGTWFPFSGQGYLNTVHFAPAGFGANTASWTFTVTPGQYLVSATWSANPNRATNAPYSVFDGTIPLSTVAVNQQLTPSDRTDSGVGWKDLGTFNITGTTLTVTLSDSANGYVIADGIRIEYKGGLPSGPVARVFDGSTLVANGGSDSFGSTFAGVPVTKTFTVKNTGSTSLTLSDPINLPSGFTLVSDFGSTTLAPGATTTFQVQLTAAAAGSYSGALSFGTNDSADNPYSFTISGTVTSTVILDDSAASGFGMAGTWFPFSGQGYLNTVHFAASGSGDSVASWTFGSLPPGKYDVAVTWSADPNRASNAPYTVLDGSKPLGTVAVNQQMTPGDFSDSGAGWKDLGTFTITGSTLVVQLSNAANGYVIADGVRIQKVG